MVQTNTVLAILARVIRIDTGLFARVKECSRLRLVESRLVYPLMISDLMVV